MVSMCSTTPSPAPACGHGHGRGLGRCLCLCLNCCFELNIGTRIGINPGLRPGLISTAWASALALLCLSVVLVSPRLTPQQAWPPRCLAARTKTKKVQENCSRLHRQAAAQWPCPARGRGQCDGGTWPPCAGLEASAVPSMYSRHRPCNLRPCSTSSARRASWLSLRGSASRARRLAALCPSC